MFRDVCIEYIYVCLYLCMYICLLNVALGAGVELIKSFVSLNL